MGVGQGELASAATAAASTAVDDDDDDVGALWEAPVPMFAADIDSRCLVLLFKSIYFLLCSRVIYIREFVDNYHCSICLSVRTLFMINCL